MEGKPAKIRQRAGKIERERPGPLTSDWGSFPSTPGPPPSFAGVESPNSPNKNKLRRGSGLCLLTRALAIQRGSVLRSERFVHWTERHEWEGHGTAEVTMSPVLFN